MSCPPSRGTTTLADTLSHTIYRWIAAGFGSGWLPKAPGTWGSIAALIPAWAMLYFCSVTSLWIAAAAVTIVGCAVCFALLPTLADKDPGWIVIDEWAGQWVALALVFGVDSFNWLWFALGFVAFRLFDILKPWPVSWAERAGPAWWSIMADDVVAGFLGGGALAVIRVLWEPA